MKSISVIVPLYNEKDSLRELHQGLAEGLLREPYEIEFIYVDDGSTDGSVDVLRRLQAKDGRIRIVRFRRNFGKSAALSAGFRLSRGDVILTIDADLQDQPQEMHKLLRKLEEGSDLVSGWKRRREDPVTKTVPSRIFNFLTAFLTGVPLHDMNCGFKVYRREVVEEIQVYGEMHRYIPVLASYRGFVVSEVAVQHRPRKYGKSKYGVTRLFSGFFDLLTVIMLTRYNRKPLHAFGIFGIVLLIAGFTIEAYLTIGWFLGRWIEDRPAFMLGVLFLIIGVQFIFFGLMAEMIAYSSRKEDDYSIREILETNSSSAATPLRDSIGELTR
jgi:glycosyltransferase involved in cell wall biosynthesis